MSTRESMRRELKELAKLADTIGRAPSVAPPAPSAPPPPPAFGAPLSAPPPRPLDSLPMGGIEQASTAGSTSALTVLTPPSLPSTPPPVSMQSRPPKRGSRGGLVALIGGALVAALVGGAALGKSLASRGVSSNAA